MNLLFGAGDSDHPLWLLAVRLNILVFLALLIALFAVSIVPWKPRLRTVLLPVTLTLLAAALRFGLALPNIFDHGGVTYSRMLAGYRGYFAVAQLYSPLYRLFGRTVERAILFNRLASTLTIPVLYSLGRKLAPDRALGPLAALLLATSPLTVQLAASTELTPMSLLLAASSYLLFIESWNELSARQGRLCWLAALAGLALLTQVRYENLLFLLPPALWAIARRPPRWTVFQSISLSLFALLIGSYVGAAIAAGPEHNPVDVPAGIRAARAVLASPFTLAPLLLAATVFTAVRRRGSWGLYTLLPWLAVTLLIVYTSPRPHHAARVFANWMLLFALIAGDALSSLLMSRSQAAKAIAILVIASVVLSPVLFFENLHYRYADIAERDAYVGGIARLPDSVRTLIVPDDERARRANGSSWEALVKYESDANAVMNRPLNIVGMTEFLEHPDANGCDVSGRCALFIGLPCLEPESYWVAVDECRELASRCRLRTLFTEAIESAPYIRCSIFTGGERQRTCEPHVRPYPFSFAAIEGCSEAH